MHIKVTVRVEGINRRKQIKETIRRIYLKCKRFKSIDGQEFSSSLKEKHTKNKLNAEVS